ncbi:MAG: coproporphyrinogen III oxidase family protein [Methanosarcinales archaeon]|nr:coproporphyrinogen III oxidase family protein [Methanosarcinales archaeon]
MVYNVYGRRKGFEMLCPLGSYPLLMRRDADDREEMVKFLTEETSTGAASSLYVHIPFCDSLCNFCCFYRVLLEENRAESYLNTLKTEIMRYSDTEYIRSSSFGSVYIGGGTPTSLETEQLAELLTLLRERFHILSDAEITVETTTHNAKREKLEALYENGVNRLSFGVQTFNDATREVLTLKDTSSDAISVIRSAQDIGFDNIDIDLMYNLPGQGMDDWKRDLQCTAELGLESISTNPLFVARGTAFAREIEKGRISGISDDRTEIDMYLLAIRELESAGYQQQNLVHFMLPEKEHAYAKMRFGQCDCLALGASAWGFLGGYLYGNARGIARYTESVIAGAESEYPVSRCARLSKDEMMRRYIIGSLHSISIDRDEFTRLFGVELTDVFRERIKGLLERGLIVSDDSTIMLTDAGKVWCTNVAEEFCPDQCVAIFEKMFGD